MDEPGVAATARIGSPMAPSAREIVVVSDLHLAGRRAIVDGFDRGSALAGFLRSLAGRARADEPLLLVILGDAFDLPIAAPLGTAPGDAGRRWGVRARDALEPLLTLHSDVVDGLAAFLATGGQLALVPGNHDAALAVPAVRLPLIERLGPPAAGAVTVHAWILYLPGLVYAEHGHQHHDLSAIPTLLRPDARPDALGAPLGRRIEDLQAAREAREGARPRGIGDPALLRAMARLTVDLARFVGAPRALARRRAVYRAEILPACAEEIGLPVETLEDLDRMSETSAWSIAARLGRRWLGGRRRWRRATAGPGSQASYLGPAASRIHALLTANGRAVPVYLFGHTHAPALEPLAGRAAGPPWYVNTGSWAPLRPPALARLVGPGRYPFVRVRAGPGGRLEGVELRVWDTGAEREDAFPG